MGASKSSGKASKQARADEAARQARIREGTSAIDSTFNNQFTPEFFDSRRTAYVDYAMPQLEQQHADARKELVYALTRAGQLDSSARAEKEAELARLFGVQKQKVADDALGFSNQAKTAVEDARGGLITMLNATGDSAGAANSALARASTLTQPQQFSPLTQLFADFTAGLGQQAALEKASAYSNGMVKPRYDTGLFGPSKTAVKVM